MLTVQSAFSGYSVDDLDGAERFYRDTLGLTVRRAAMGGLELDVTGGAPVFVYPKDDDHEPASYTVLNLVVPDIVAAADHLAENDVPLERYEGFDQDERGIVHSTDPDQGPTIAWFRDPARNVIALIQAD